MPTKCPQCPATLKAFGTSKEYAEHILAKHKDDSMRVSFANEVLHPTAQPEPKMTLKSIIFGHGMKIE